MSAANSSLPATAGLLSRKRSTLTKASIRPENRSDLWTPNMIPRGVSRADFGKQGEDFMNPTTTRAAKGVVGLDLRIPDFNISRTGNAIASAHGTRLDCRREVSNAERRRATLPSIVISPEMRKFAFCR
jgi:hypothetical protein